MLRRWKSRNGYRDVLSVSLPLIVSMGSVTLMQFTDRIFLGRYSLAAIAAALPAGIASFLFVSFFLGAVSFTGVFVAQYAGAGRPQRIGCALWAGGSTSRWRPGSCSSWPGSSWPSPFSPWPATRPRSGNSKSSTSGS